MLRGVQRVFALMVGLMVMIAVFGTIVTLANEARTVEAIEAGLMCSTDVGETSCVITLVSPHAFAFTADGMVVLETAPGSTDRTSTSSLASNRTTLTVAGLSASTAYTFTVTHDTDDTNNNVIMNTVLERMGLWIGLAIVAMLVVGLSVYR